MYGVIKAEVFRPDYSSDNLKYLAMGLAMGAKKPEIYTRPWVARIEGLDRKFGYKRSFMRGAYDYTTTNNASSRGTYIYYAVPPGIYEVCRNVTWTRFERFFCRVDDNGNIHEISREEVEQCLKNADSE